jgi:hypothetical protein
MDLKIGGFIFTRFIFMAWHAILRVANNMHAWWLHRQGKMDNQTCWTHSVGMILDVVDLVFLPPLEPIYGHGWVMYRACPNLSVIAPRVYAWFAQT